MFTHIQITILLSAPKSYAGHMIYLYGAHESGFYPAFTLDTEARGLLPFYAILVQLDTFTVLRQNALTMALTFTLSPPYDGAALGDGGSHEECVSSLVSLGW
jgi:hypothetical protein